MSQSGNTNEADSSGGEESRKEPGTQSENLRFTPLRSYVTAARLSRDAGGKLALSRLIPVPRLQG